MPFIVCFFLPWLLKVEVHTIMLLSGPATQLPAIFRSLLLHFPKLPLSLPLVFLKLMIAVGSLMKGCLAGDWKALLVARR